MIQILGLRDYFNSKKNKTEKTHKFFSEGWQAPSVVALMRDPEKYIAQVPEEYRWNLYFTVANCHGKKERDFNYQTVLPIDIDHIDVTKQEETARAACDAIGLSYNFTGVLFSGNGLQLFVLLDESISSPKYFNEYRAFYKAMCKRIEGYLREKGLAGDLDSSVFSDARLMRMPLTENRKPNKESRVAQVLQGCMEPQGFDLKKASGIPVVHASEQVDLAYIKASKVDTDSVLKGCSFLQYCKDNQDTVDEPSWYAMLGVLAHLKNGTDLAHEYSKQASSYTPEDTNEKLGQAKAASGPRTCENINALWGGCHNCKFYGKQKSPVVIKGDDYIATKDTGFRHIKTTESGKIKDKKPICFEDLVKYYSQKYKYLHTADTKEIYIYKEGVWAPINEAFLKNFAQKHIVPPPLENDRKEFVAALKAENVHTTEEMASNSEGKVNMLNGVYDIETGEILEHSPDFFFKWKLPFAYDKDAQCPKFEKFLSETFDHEDEVQFIKEYMGYCLSGDLPWSSKCLILIGEGANGKSVLVDILRGLTTKENRASFPLKEILSKNTTRYAAKNALFNANEESSLKVPKEGIEVFKNLTDGGETDVRAYYSQEVTIRWYPKFLFCMNERMTLTPGSERALKRRLVNIRCNHIVPVEKRNPFLAKEILEEASGIFNLVFEAYLKAKEIETLTVPASSEKEVQETLDESDTVVQWMKHKLHYTGEKGDNLTLEELFDDYKSLCKEDGIKFPVSRGKFKNRAKSLIESRFKGVKYTQVKIGAKRVRAFIGLKTGFEEAAESIAEDRF